MRERESRVAIQGTNIAGSESRQCKGPEVAGGLACLRGYSGVRGRGEDMERVSDRPYLEWRSRWD